MRKSLPLRVNSENLNTGRSILPATESLLREISEKGDYTLANAYKSAILHFGSKTDADKLLEHYIKNPTDPFAADLLEIVGRWGDTTHAQKIFAISIQEGRLLENFPEQVLEVLGQLGYEEAKPVLVHYAFKISEYYLNKSAVHGLLHFDCSEYQQEITRCISDVLDKNLFPEFLPALISKLDDRKELLDQLFSSGSTIISTDCNAGIFLGFSLCGEEGKTYFKNALFDPNWEAYYNAGRCALTGLHNLNISFAELLKEASGIQDEKILQYHMLVIISLLEIKASSYKYEGESFESIYSALISTQLLSTLAEKAGLLADAEKVEELLIFRMREEVLLKNK